MKKLMPIRFFLNLVLLMVAISLSGCLESSFELAPESRLPKWFEAPAGVPRGDLRVTMDYHSTFSGGEYVFKFYKKNQFFKIKEINVNIDMAPRVELKELPPGFPKGYPKYYAVTVNGVTDIIEHRKMEPTFYVTDNPNVWRELGVENISK